MNPANPSTPTWITRAMTAVLLVLLSTAEAQQSGHTRFWLTETIAGTTTGPIPSLPGTRFEAAGKAWLILGSKPGQILFSEIGTSKHHGPYKLEPQRIIMLGGKAMLFSQVEFTGTPETPPPRTILTEIPAPPASARPPRPDEPKGWERKPLPGTNPGEHRVHAAPFSLTPRTRPPSVQVWIEPIHSVQYDWSVGGFSGNSGEELESSRIGAGAGWRNVFVEAGLINDANVGGAIVPDGTVLSNLELDGGSGFSLAGGYTTSVVIDGNWNASVGGFARYERISFDMNATVLTEQGAVIEPDPEIESEIDADADTITHHYEFESFSSDFNMQTLTLGACAGIDYATPVWGGGVSLLVDVYTDIQTSGSIEVVGGHYALSPDQTHPVGVAFSGWFVPYADWFVSADLTVGTQKALRIGLGRRF